MAVLYIIGALTLLLLLLSYIAYLICFRGRIYDLDITRGDTLDKPPYTGYGDMIREGIRFNLTHEHEDVSIRSFDGLTLAGKYYAAAGESPLLIMCHGYRGAAEHDFSCGLPYFLAHGFSILLIDERAHGRSGGRSITFGVNERRDIADWARYAAGRWPGRKIVLDGISMGAASVVMASALDLPREVCAVVADCPYTSPGAIIRKVARDYHVPGGAFYSLARIGARLWGGFDPEDASALEAVKTSTLPLFLCHGEADTFVPCDMSRALFEASASAKKRLVTVPGADHGLSFVADRDKVTGAMAMFFDGIL